MKGPAVGLALTMILGGAAAPRAQEPAPDPSLARMRAVLQHAPLRTTLPAPEANFKVEIKAIHPMHEIFETPAWATAPVGWQPPGVGFDLLSVFRDVARSAADAKRAHDVHAARVEVQRAIDDYCAAQPNRYALQLCSSSPVFR